MTKTQTQKAPMPRASAHDLGAGLGAFKEKAATMEVNEVVERQIKGIPVKTFIDEVFKQEKARRAKIEEGGNPDDCPPIMIPGIGLHAI